MASFKTLLCLTAVLSGLGALPVPSPAPAATRNIENTAQLSFTTSGTDYSLASNTIVLEFDRTRMPTVLKYYRMPVGFNYDTLTCQASPPAIHGAEITEAQLDNMVEDDGVADHSLGIVLWDTPGNRNPNVRETQTVHGTASSGETGDLILTETGPNTGVFAGGFSSTSPTGHAQACLPVFPAGTTFDVTFDGDEDAFGSTDSILIDPFGHVFDSVTGKPVDGAIVTLINDATGLPATVYGDDGVSRYPSTVISGQDVTDAGGQFYDYDIGDYRFPLTEPGQYHLQIQAPRTHVAPSEVAPANLPTSYDGIIYTVSAGSYGAQFDLTSPEPLNIDIPVDPVPHGTLTLEKTSSVREASPGDVVPYHLIVGNPESALMRGARITDTLPAGLRYRKGSTTNTAEPAVSADGRTLSFDLGDIRPNGHLDIRYAVEVLPGAPVGDAVNRAIVDIFGSDPSPEATASVRIQPLLFSDAQTLVGRVVEGDCQGGDLKGVPGVRILLENGTYVVTDRDGLYHFEGVRKGRHVVQLDTNSLSAAYEPVTCHDDTRWAGSAISRFVEGDGGSLHRVDFILKKTGKIAEAATEKLPITVMDADVAAGGRTNWLLGQAPGIDWLFPEIDHNPRNPALRVAIKHLPGQRVALTVNGKTTDPLAFDGTDTADGVAVSVWTALPLVDGDNRLEARVLDADGKLVKTLSREVHYANVAFEAKYVPNLSRLIADGKTRPLVAVRITDRDGRPVRDGTQVPFRLDAPYTAAQALDMQQDRQLAGMERAETTVQVTGDDGMAFIALAPTTQTGQAHVTFSLTQDKTTRKSEIDAWLKAGDQDWVVVGFGQGTLGYDTLSKNTRRYWVPKDRNLHTDGQIALYAKGRIKGSWLLTMAYDSDRTFDPQTGLMSTIDPDRYYTVYGDGSRQAYDAATSRKLYLRLERNNAYIMMGDFETDMKATQLTRFNRTLNGIKAGYHGQRLTATGFAARSDQRYARDEIQGNGLSGPYRLSAGGLISNSDKITIETRDRFRSEKVLDSKPMARHIDYDIDPDAGTITFREPILSRDSSLNPVFIVVDYELAGNGDKRVIAGGRIAAKVTEHIEIGASVLKDESQNDATVAGIDLKAQINATTELRAEAATGGEHTASDATAYLIEVEHHGAKIDAQVYVRHQDEGFGVGQQNFTEAGTHKIGVDGQVRLTEQLTLTGALWQQESTVRETTRVAGEMKLEYRRKNGTLFLAASGASDEGNPAGISDANGKQTSRLLTIGGSQTFLDEKLQLNGQVQFALGDAKSNLEFPIRHQISAAYKLNDTVRLIAGHEIANGNGIKAHTSRIGFDLTPWHGAKLATTLNQLALGENGQRSFAQFGLSQSLPIGKRWTVDATLDSSKTLKGGINPEAVNPFDIVTGGTSLNNDGNADFTSATIGATYRAALWSWNGRIEARHSTVADRTGLTSNVIRTLGEGKTVASSLRVYTLKDREGRKAELASADVSLAWRPLDSHWSVLERLELRHNRADANVTGASVLGIPVSTGENQITTRLINNVAVNYRSDLREGRGVEMSVYYGAKFIKGKLADDSYDGFIDVLGLDIRKSMGKRFDLAFALSQQTAHSSGVKALSYGPSVGYSPRKDVWVSVGYNISGYRDPDSDGSRYTQQGPYVTVRVKFDQTGLGSMMKNAF